MRRVLIAGSVFLGFLLGLALLVAVVRLGYWSPWRKTPKKLNPNIPQKTVKHSQSPLSFSNPTQNEFVPLSIRIAERKGTYADA